MRDMIEGQAALEAVEKTEAEEKPALPVFTPRWWHKPNRLDARPVIWSLRNRPQDWKITDRTARPDSLRWRPTSMIHTPSNHMFWTWHLGTPRLYDARCSCNDQSDRGRFQPFQNRAFKDAVTWWLRNHGPKNPADLAVDQQQFASHFVR